MIFLFRIETSGVMWARRVLLPVVLALGTVASSWGQTGLTLHGNSVEGENGKDVAVEFRAEGFWQITEGMGTIQWDPHVADYVRAGDFGIPELSEGSFTLIPGEGMLTFQWNTGNPLGTTVPDGTVVFSLTFGVRGEAGQSTTVAFSNGWTELHFESAENINLPFSSVPGNVSVVPEPGVALLSGVGLLGMLAARVRRR